MTLFKLLILFLTLSAACGLRCYTCTAADPKSCIDTKACAAVFDRCFSLKVEGYDIVTKGCQTSALCVGAMKCCEGNLCNSSASPGSSSLLIMLTVAMFILLL